MIQRRRFQIPIFPLTRAAMNGEIMESQDEKAVERAIAVMYQDFNKGITLNSVACAAMFSKFYFSRVFRRVTGITPGRFLSAVRLQAAKKLLVSSSMTVGEISHEVGYQSVGTFSWRFKNSTGVTPTAYRRLGGYTHQLHVEKYRKDLGDTACGTIRGEISPPRDGQPGQVLIDLIRGPIPEDQPIRCTQLARPGRYTFENVPSGSWYVRAYCLPVESGEGPADGGSGYVGIHGPIRVGPDIESRDVNVGLRPMRPLDFTVLFGLPEMRFSKEGN
jgi:AraC-like DNA-binding protein